MARPTQPLVWHQLRFALPLDCWVFFGRCLFCASGCLLQVQEIAFSLVGSAIP